MRENSAAICIKCNAALSASGFFCSSCGWDQRRGRPLRLGAKQIGLILAGSLVLWGGIYSTSASLAGTKPTRHAVAPTDRTPINLSDEALREQRESARESDDVSKLRSFAATLVARVRDQNPPAQAEVLELVDVLSRILKLDPKDSEALLILGDISFERQIFDKALGYYKRFVELNPDDLSVRSRYASALTVTGDPQAAIGELNSILTKQPDFFPALAYLTVAYSQAGRLADAQATGEKALEKAPTPEAGKELRAFLDRVKGGAVQQLATPSSVAASANGSPSSEQQNEYLALEEALRKNPIAGPKFVRLESRGNGIVQALFKDFPMAAMPPFAREKFFGGLNKVIKDHNLKVTRVEFKDAQSGELLSQMEVKG